MSQFKHIEMWGTGNKQTRDSCDITPPVHSPGWGRMEQMLQTNFSSSPPFITHPWRGRSDKVLKHAVTYKHSAINITRFLLPVHKYVNRCRHLAYTDVSKWQGRLLSVEGSVYTTTQRAQPCSGTQQLWVTSNPNPTDTSRKRNFFKKCFLIILCFIKGSGRVRCIQHQKGLNFYNYKQCMQFFLKLWDFSDLTSLQMSLPGAFCPAREVCPLPAATFAELSSCTTLRTDLPEMLESIVLLIVYKNPTRFASAWLRVNFV